MKHRDALNDILTGIFSKLKRQQAIELMERNTVPCAPVYSIDETYSDPQVVGNTVELPHPDFGTLRFGANPVRLSSTPVTGYAPPPHLGEHTEAILKNVLSIDDAEISALREKKII